MAVSIYTFERFRKGECNSNKGNWTNWANWREKIALSFGNNSVILRISYVYVTYILRIWYVIDSGKIGGIGRIVVNTQIEEPWGSSIVHINQVMIT